MAAGHQAIQRESIVCDESKESLFIEHVIRWFQKVCRIGGANLQIFVITLNQTILQSAGC